MLIRLSILLILTIVPTVIHGRMTYRWGTPAELKETADFVSAIPKQLGDWNYVTDAKTITPSVIAELGVTEYVSRIYSRGNDTVTLLLMAGKTGRLIRHTPDICYGSTGNTFLAEPTIVSLDINGKPHEFRVLKIRPESELSGDFVVVYGFAHAGKFMSPSTPRLTYHGIPAIEKIQVLCRAEPDKLGEIPEYAKPFIEEVCRYVQQEQGEK